MHVPDDLLQRGSFRPHDIRMVPVFFHSDVGSGTNHLTTFTACVSQQVVAVQVATFSAVDELMEFSRDLNAIAPQWRMRLAVSFLGRFALVRQVKQEHLAVELGAQSLGVLRAFSDRVMSSSLALDRLVADGPADDEIPKVPGDALADFCNSRLDIGTGLKPDLRPSGAVYRHDVKPAKPDPKRGRPPSFGLTLRLPVIEVKADDGGGNLGIADRLKPDPPKAHSALDFLSDLDRPVKLNEARVMRQMLELGCCDVSADFRLARGPVLRNSQFSLWISSGFERSQDDGGEGIHQIVRHKLDTQPFRLKRPDSFEGDRWPQQASESFYLDHPLEVSRREGFVHLGADSVDPELVVLRAMPGVGNHGIASPPIGDIRESSTQLLDGKMRSGFCGRPESLASCTVMMWISRF